MNAIDVSGLSFAYRGRGGSSFRLEVPEFVLEEGGSVALLGESGSGKSTLLKIFAGALSGFSGGVSVSGCDLSTDAGRRALPGAAAFLFQDAPMFRGTVRDNVAIGLAIRGADEKTISERVDAALAAFGIGDLAGRDAALVSGGQARRVCLARIMVMRPRVLFLDEPFHSLDAVTRHGVMRDLESFVASIGSALFLITHDRDEALTLARRIVVMKDGRILQDCPAEQAYKNPSSEAVAGLLGRYTVLCGESAGTDGETSVIKCGGASFIAAGRRPAGERVRIMISPGDVVLSRAGGPDSSARNHFDAAVVSMSHNEYGRMVTLDVGGAELLAYVTSPSCETMGLSPGARVTASVKATAILTFTAP